MATIITRAGKGSPLTNNEVDSNFTNLNTAKLEATNILPVHGLDITTDVNGNVLLDVRSFSGTCKNVSGATIAKGTPVYQVGVQGQAITVAPARADDPAKMPAVGVAGEDLLNEAEGDIIFQGYIQEVNTSAFNIGDEIYVGSTGGYTNIKPINGSGNLIQFLGIVNKIHASAGSGIIFGTATAHTQTYETTDEVSFARVTVDNVRLDGNTVSTTSGNLILNAAGVVDASAKRITNLAEPTSDTDAVTKLYVDSIAQGLHTHAPSAAATPDTLASITGGTITYDNGTSGVGATLTVSGGTFSTIDGVNIATVGTRILVKNEVNAAHNGIYVYTSSTVLTRASDFDTAVEMAGGDFTFVQNGTLYNDTGWVLADPVTTIGTTPVNIVQFSGAGTYTAGTGLNLNGTVFSLANTTVTAGSYGSSTQIPSLTIDAQGRVTAASNNSITVGDGALTLGVSGNGLSGAASFTANQSTNQTFTVTSNATSDNTASTIVYRDASGNFSAGTISAALTGNASTATKWATPRTITLTGDVTGVSGDFDGSENLSFSTTLADSGVTAGTFGSSTAIPSITVNSKGIITSISTNSITVGEGVLTVQGSSGLSGTGTFSANASENVTITLENTDKGSSQSIFKNIANNAGTTQFSATSNNDSLRFEGSGATSVAFDNATKKITISSTDTNTTYTAGNGLSLSGTEFNVGAGNYITVAADTVAVDATSANTASKVVARDANGDFSTRRITSYTRQENYGITTDATTRAGIMGGTSGGTLTVPTQTGSGVDAYSILPLSYTGTEWVGGAGLVFTTTAAQTSANRGINAILRAIPAGSFTASDLVWNGSTLIANGTTLTGNLGTVTSITAGTGLTGGTITGSGTLALSNTAVTPGAYTNANITVDAQGRITLAANGSGGGGGITYTVKTSNYTAVAGEGILANTIGGGFIITLPINPLTGDQIIVADPAGSWTINNLIIARNGKTIENVSEDLICNIDNASVELIYDGSTWQVFAKTGAFIQDSILSVNRGGTGTNNFSSGSILIGNGTSSFNEIFANTDPRTYIGSNGSAWIAKYNDKNLLYEGTINNVGAFSWYDANIINASTPYKRIHFKVRELYRYGTNTNLYWNYLRFLDSSGNQLSSTYRWANNTYYQSYEWPTALSQASNTAHTFDIAGSNNYRYLWRDRPFWCNFYVYTYNLKAISSNSYTYNGVQYDFDFGGLFGSSSAYGTPHTYANGSGTYNVGLNTVANWAGFYLYPSSSGNYQSGHIEIWGEY